MVCPYYKNKKVFDEFNQIVLAFGGRPMTEEEFLSSELRNQRTGQDLIAIESAYILWDRNNGYPLSKNPDGSSSVTYQKLVYVYGDELSAIKERSKLYSLGYINKHGDWFSLFYAEPSIDTITEQYNTDYNDLLIDFEKQFTVTMFDRCKKEDIFSLEDYESLSNGQYVSSGSILTHILNTNPELQLHLLLQILQKHDVPVVFGSTSFGKLAVTVHEDGGSIIVLNKEKINGLSKRFVIEAVAHELIHAATLNAILNPNSKQEILLSEINHDTYQRVLKIFKNKKYDLRNYQNCAYMMANEAEFIAYFASDESVRQLLFLAARQYDSSVAKQFKSVVKKIANALALFFVNKNIFNTTEQLLHIYEKAINDYLNNRSRIIGGDISDFSSLKLIYNNINNGIAMNEVNQWASNALDLQLKQYEAFPIDEKSIATYEGVCRTLATRLLSVKQSPMSRDQRLMLQLDTETMIDLLRSENVAKFSAIQSIVAKAGPYILDKIRYLKEKGKDVTADEMEFMLHSDFNTYKILCSNFTAIMLNGDFSASSMMNEYNSMLEEGQEPITAEDIKNLESQIDDLYTVCNNASLYLRSVRKEMAILWLREIGHQLGSDFIDEYLENIFDLTDSSRPDDMSSLEYLFGAVDLMDNESLRIIGHLVNSANKKADEETLDRLIDLISAAKQISRKDISLMYERDKRGRTTGYLLRKRNYGVFLLDYDDFMKLLNLKISKKYNIELEENNRRAPKNEEARREWQLARNEWLDLHCDRLYQKEYYDAWANVSEDTRSALRDINNLIYQLTHLEKIYDSKTNTFHYENFTDEEWDLFLSLSIKKRLLRSRYGIYGEKKTGTALKISNELNDLYDKLYKDGDVKKNKDAWLDARLEVIKECGGIEEYKKFQRGEDCSFDSKKLNKWDERNSVLKFKQTDEGELEVFQKIYREIGGNKPYYGEEYEKISDEINEKLRPFKGPDGRIIASKLTEAIKGDIKKLIKKQSKIRKEAIRNNPSLKDLKNKYGKIFQKYIEFKETQEFSEIRKSCQSTAEGDIFLYEAMISAYGDSYFDINLGMFTSFTPYRWYTYMVSKEEKYMELAPGEAWIERSENTKYKNDKFDETENTTMVPKLKITGNQNSNGALAKLGIKVDLSDRNRYDNSDLYNRITKPGSATAKYYELAKLMIVDSNKMQTNRPIVDNYLLPQITGSLWKRLQNRNWFSGADSKWNVFWQWVGLIFGVSEENDLDTYGLPSLEIDEEGNVVKKEYDPFSDVYASSMPDGSPYRAMPQFFTRKLKDTGFIHSNMTAILATYYNMSVKYREKSKIASQCEIILDLFNDNISLTPSFYNKAKKAVSRVGGGIHSEKSNVYKAGRAFLDSNLYDIKMEATEGLGINWTKLAGNIKRWTTATNLGMNPKVAVVGFFTTLFTHTINSITGQKYDIKTSIKASVSALWSVFTRCLNGDIFNNLSNDKGLLVLEMCGVANQFGRKSESGNLPPILEFINRHGIFGFMSMFDYIAKSQITRASFMAYRLVDGKFITKDDIRMNSHMANGDVKKWRKRMYEKWEDGISLWDALEVDEKNHKLKMPDEYKEAWDKIKYVVINRAEKFCEHADGMATEEQKGAITRSIIGSLILIHRQYLPLMVQERFGHTVYDYDTHMYKGGQFRRILNLCYNMAVSNKLAAIGTGAAIGSMLPVGAVGYVIGALGMLALSKRAKNSQKGSMLYADTDKSMRQLFKEAFYDFSNKKATVNTLMNRYAIKQVVAELSMYKAIVSTIAGIICYYADQPDKKKWNLLQMLAYWARGVLWEASTPYRFKEVLDAIKSPTAALSLVDRSLAFVNTVGDSLLFLPLIWIASLCVSPLLSDPLLDVVKRGAYKGHSTEYKTTMKATPYKNIYEQWYDSKSKRTYQEKQLMNISNKDKEKFNDRYSDVKKFLFE